jgi:hypothetical protein
MITYSTNFMGPISTQWFVERGLTKKVKRIHRSNIIAVSKGARVGDEYEIDELTENYAGGRIDIRDDSKEGYDGWNEYAVKIMHGEDWNALSEYLDGLETETLLDYDELINQFESQYGNSIRWAPDPRAN